MNSDGTNWHHPYTKKYRKYGREKKRVDAREHAAFHAIVGDKDPINALNYIILNFMPSELSPLMGEVKKYREKILP